jgi:hypothetical protein
MKKINLGLATFLRHLAKAKAKAYRKKNFCIEVGVVGKSSAEDISNSR